MGYVLTALLNDDLGKWVRGARRDSALKNVYLRMAALQYVTERHCQGRARDKCRAGILALLLVPVYSGGDTHREAGVRQL